MRLSGKVAVVTGGGKNLGREICLTFAHQGADIAVHVHSSISEGESLIKEINEMGRKAILVKGDISNLNAVNSMFRAIGKAFTRIDILVNNAALRIRHDFLEISPEEWSEIIGVQLNGPFYCCREAVPFMIRQNSGSIINVSGGAGFSGGPQTHVAATKAALHGMTKSLAYNLGKYNIRANTLVPSHIQTLHSKQWFPEGLKEEEQENWLNEYMKSAVKAIPLGRFATTKDIANACLFLASEESAYITGQALHVNGGFQMY